MRAALTVLVICAVLSSCGNPSPSEEASPLSSPTRESPGSDSTSLSTAGSGRTADDGFEATGRLTVTNRYPFDDGDLPVFPSPDGRMYLNVAGCVVPISDDRQAACPDGDRWVASASWAPDGSFVVHDEAAFVSGSDSDIHAVFIEDPTGDSAERAP